MKSIDEPKEQLSAQEIKRNSISAVLDVFDVCVQAHGPHIVGAYAFGAFDAELGRKRITVIPFFRSSSATLAL